jgi:hypothetical protein
MRFTFILLALGSTCRSLKGINMRVGFLTNASKIKSTFKSVIQSDISLNTIKSYIEYLKDAYILSEANRYDVKGRKYIDTPLKYYFEDVGLRNARLGFRQVEENHLMDNIIYNELRVRGYQVDVGVVIKRVRNDEGAQQKASLINVNDSFKKIIVVKDIIKPWHDEDGILTMSIYNHKDFLNYYAIY